MNKHLLQILWAFLLLAGCSPTPTSSIPSTAVIQPSPTLPPKVTNTPILTQTSTVLPPPTVEPTTPTWALPPESIFKYQPLKILPSLPANAEPIGSLVLQDEEKSYFINFASHSQQDIPGNNACMSTSPNGKWLAYCQASPDNSKYQWLIIEGVDRQQIKIPMGQDWFAVPFGFWLDNEQLVFNLQPAPDGELFPVLIINPFTSKQTTIRSDYPEIDLDTSISPGRLIFIKSSVIYDPSLETVIYPRFSKGDLHVVYWDRVHGKTLAKIQEPGFDNAPLWSPDLTQFAVPIVKWTDSSFSHYIEDWFSVSRTGEVEQITHWGDFFTDTKIGLNGNWSPNGRYVAFWLETQPSECEGPNLAVLDMETQQTINYCVPGVFRDYIPPIWSLDSRYVAVNSPLGDASNQTVLVDLQEGWAAQIAEATFPMGWLATEP